MSWSTFIKAHWGAIAATDLFTVEVVNPFGLVRYHVLFVIDIVSVFATGPRAVGFTIVWPEGVIFRSMMTYHVKSPRETSRPGELVRTPP